jgi:hypothetical protein
MGRISRVKRAYLKQKRTRVDEIRLRELNREAHDRAASGHHVLVRKDIYGFGPIDTDEQFNNFKRRLLGLEECSIKSSREEILAKMNRVADSAELVYRIGDKAMFLIRDGNYYYFLYRERGKYYKKSVLYDSRTKAMDRNNTERITWIKVYSE